MVGRESPSSTPPGLTVLPLATSTPPSNAVGRRDVAARIVTLAQAHGVNLPKDADLDQLLSALHIHDSIPIPAFAVVAEILFAILSVHHHHHADWETAP